MRTVEWAGDGVRLIDQTRLPEEESYVVCRTAAEVARAIREMLVRGAPAIGVAAAYGAALAAREGRLAAGVAEIRAARPTARDLFWAVELVERAQDPLAEAHRIAEESVEACRAMGRHGAALLPAGVRVVTICNTGALATVEYGTGLGVVRAAHEAGKRPFVYVMETRPRAQGARLTTWELRRLGIPHRLLVDSAAGLLLRRGMADAAISGADRVCANGDVVNKVGTYPLALLAHEHGVPFYAVAPTSTLDSDCPDGDNVQIEERDGAEVATFAPPGTPTWNPAFDVTPARLVTALITERGALQGAPA
ncbi:MAG: S-methyl-5-thioribose-1-phosphate isomerase [Candidatus Nephthysia bennettiae]|uniref:Methylthioribose-1-phosphate isomerase n=1 Tax=Candidatus Nephthysia bennettiae TaxID=3127016 RepID=A0A934NAK2_9BACT|nr:S-methyl-5-thioribose-1-phosphate isomerase [Candidatus Dormibacteraeota bacterium]MBJ7612930.1 S-methyl-5-thioribose-1-phosphate isomerase [Candidatus Dormibacteraeota bacterium]PZR85466.1 MAG: S-methyl-5-thioribose-1-phosphate isomerase [Candidatus Dormibacteraeota bacterium]